MFDFIYLYPVNIIVNIKIRVDQDIEKNAEAYFQASKTAKKKIKGAKKMVEKAKRNLKKDEEVDDTVTIHLDKRERKWYESYHWIHTTNEYLAIGGRSASSNEAVIKKHCDPSDLVFHTDAPGSPFVVLKKGGDAEKEDRKDAATLAGLYSKAWKHGVREVDVMEVSPDQVTKETQAGEYIGKGSFMIYGERKEHTVTLDLGIGLRRIEDDILLMGGPEHIIKQYCSAYVFLGQGNKGKGDISKHVMKILHIARNDSILPRLPSGTFRIKEKHVEGIKNI